VRWRLFERPPDCRRAYIDALGEEPATYRSDAERLMKAAEGAGSVDALAAMPEVQVSEEIRHSASWLKRQWESSGELQR